MSIRFVALDTTVVSALQAGQPDANGQVPERHISDGGGVPCRHCLQPVEAGEAYLILAHRPFPGPQPYAELGPIFLHADGCPRYQDDGGVPAMLRSPQYLIRGYSDADRIVYGSGQIVPTEQIRDAAGKMFGDERISYVHVRSASNNCYQCRIDKD
jgi:hypothetical protein